MSNNIESMTDSQLQALATQMDSILAVTYAAYGLTAANATALTAADSTFTTGLTDVAAKKAAYRSAVQSKLSDRANLTAIMSTIIGSIYLNPAVSPEMIAALGLQPRATTRSKQTPKTSEELVATLTGTGEVKLVWKRGENTYGAVYVIESKIGNGVWTQVSTTTKTRIILEGFPPSTAAWFRIRTTRNGLWSSPSNNASIYAPEAEFALHIAA